MSIFTPNKTSARLMVDFAEEEWMGDGDQANAANKQRFLLLYDLYIKARSYAIINKIAFHLSIIMGLAVLLWPSLAYLNEYFNQEYRFLKSAIVQTTVTAIGALFYALYSHYKKRQMSVENLMRLVIHGPQSGAIPVETYVAALENIDSGFSFSKNIDAANSQDRS